jgi:hypothetical protein
VGAVRYHGFSLVKPESAVCPEYFSADSIRDINRAIAVQGDHARFGYIEIGIVPCHYRIVLNRGSKFRDGFDATRNH